MQLIIFATDKKEQHSSSNTQKDIKDNMGW